MDYSSLTEQQLQKKYNSLPDKLKDILRSENAIEAVRQISRSHYLDEERNLIFEQLIGLIILGFLSVEELNQEIQKNLLLNPKHASELSNEINRKIFAPIKSDLEQNYSPLTTIPEIKPEISKEEIKPELTKLPPGAPLQPIEIEAFKPAAPPMADTKTKLPDFEPVIPSDSIPTDKPFMIHQEAGARSVTEKKKVAMPAIGWFKKAMPAGRQERPKMPESSIKVQLETFGPKIEERKEPITAKTETPKQRIVHYREVENPAPFGKSGAQLPKESQPSKIETPAIKPFNTAQGKSEPLKSSMPGKPFGATRGGPEQSVKPAEPKVIDLESFFEVTEKKENGIKNEVGLDGNTINLKDNKK